MPGYSPLRGTSTENSLGGDAGSAQACCLSCPWLPSRKLAFPSEPSWLSLGGTSLPSSVSIHVSPSPLQLGSHSALLKRPCPHSPFLWLKGRNEGERTVHFFVHPSEVEARMARSGLLTSFGLKALILTRFDAAGWQLVHVVGVVPRTRALGGAPGR